MSYQILPTLIFVLAIFAAILMVLRRLPEANNVKPEEKPKLAAGALAEKGLPTEKFSKIKHHSVFWTKRMWRFVLEAKEIAPTGASVLKLKRLFAAKKKQVTVPVLAGDSGAEEISEKSEEDYLELIKKEPKNYTYYDGLGKVYLQQNKLEDAKDIYLYLTSHASGMADYWARLGFTSFRLKDYKLSAESYNKSVSLDSSQPNRYYNLAQSYKALGEIKEAKEALALAMQMNPDNPKFIEFQKRLG